MALTHSLSIRFFPALVLLSLHLHTVFGIGATIIQSRRGWLMDEGADALLDCQVFSSGGRGTDYRNMCARVGFTANGSIVMAGGDPRREFSGPFHEAPAMAAYSPTINCTMSIRKLQLADSGSYGCCWIDATSGQCPPHPVKTLVVIPFRATTIPMSSTTSISTATAQRISVADSSTLVTRVYHLSTLRQGQDETHHPSPTPHPTSGNQVSLLPNDARIQSASEGKSSIHQAAWSAVLTLTILLIAIVIGLRYMKRRKEIEEHIERLPEDDPELAEQHPNEIEDENTGSEMHSLDLSVS